MAEIKYVKIGKIGNVSDGDGQHEADVLRDLKFESVKKSLEALLETMDRDFVVANGKAAMMRLIEDHFSDAGVFLTGAELEEIYQDLVLKRFF